ncbi:MAG: tRNA pseudouridine(55) synthase TruB, partial [Rhodocyclaceae bacterium]
ALGCGAHLAALRRMRVGPLDIAQAATLAALEAMPDEALDRLLLPTDALLGDSPVAMLTAAEAARLLHGQEVRWMGKSGQLYRLVAPQGFIGIGVLAEDGWLKPKRLIACS